MTQLKKVFLIAFVASILFGCKKSNETINSLEEPLKVSKEFSKKDFQRIKKEVAQISKSISFAISKTKLNPNFNSRGNSFNTSNSQNGCNSYYSNEYNTTCFTGYATEFLVDENPNIYYTPSNIGLANNLDLNVVGGFNNFGVNGDPNYFLNQNQLTSNSETTMNSLGTEQSHYADSLENISTLTDVSADQLMTSKVVDQENRILNNPNLSYEDKEYVLTTLEL